MVYLKEANYEDLEKEWQYIAAMPEDENGLTNQWPGISREDFEKSALPEIIDHSKGLNMPDWMVAETFLFLWDDDTIVGLFRLRQYLNDALREGAIYRKNATKTLSAFCLTHLLYTTSVMELEKHIAEKVTAQKVWHLLWNMEKISFLKMSFICG